ncbi:MAG: hypothetical protein A2Z37_12645 [Chloroflexi bacterium RBG_19FT_COMBO_62_14]|nr:MAG: hypothetical protein A2Z37_12645 [Chloroflexi bacterium RBG_19FT_COMBO_62_14]
MRKMTTDGELRLLVADDDQSLLDLMVRRLGKMGITPDQALDGAQAQALIEQNDYDVIITDIYMPEVTGLELLHIAKERDPNVQVVVATASATIDNAVDALNNGAFAYLTKPFDHLSVFDKVVTRAMEFRQLLLDNRRMAEVQRRRGDMLEDEVTQRIRQLRDRQRDLLNLLTSLPLGVAVIEEGGRVAMSNPQAEKWLAQERHAKEQPILEFINSVHQTESEPSVEVEINGRMVRLTAVDVLHGTPRKQKVVIIGEMEGEEQSISQGTMVEDAFPRLRQGLVWLATQPLEPGAAGTARGLVKEVVSLGRMMGFSVEEPQIPEPEPTLEVEGFEERPEPSAVPELDEEDARLIAALEAPSPAISELSFESIPPAKPETAVVSEPISRPAPEARSREMAQPPKKAASKPEAEPPPARDVKPAAKVEKKAPVVERRLLRKAKELESGGWRPPALPAKSGTNGQTHEEAEVPPDDSVLSRLASVTGDSPKAKPPEKGRQFAAERETASRAPEPEPIAEEAKPKWTAYEESETGSSRAGHKSGTWPPPLPSAIEAEEDEEASSEE